MHTIDCPNCVNGWQERDANLGSGYVRCIECDGTGEIKVEDEDSNETNLQSHVL